MSHALDTTISSSVPAASSIPRAGFLDTLAILGEVLIPTIAKGVIIRRPTMVALAEYLDLDRRAVRRMQRVRNRYGTGPLLLPIPGRSMVMILDPRHVHRVLAESPEPFATASAEKRAALRHFEPKGALISHGPERTDRRRFNEATLQSDSAVHRMAEPFLKVVSSEAARLRRDVHRRGGELAWDNFSDAWFRVVRRVVFGDAATEDHELSSAMARLRSAGNWAFLRPVNKDLREQLLHRIRQYLRRAEPGSLAGMAATVYQTGQTAPEHQVPQWLFAFDPAGMTTFRSLALLASHPEHADRAREEIGSGNGAARPHMPYLRATVLESLRLWPTTPLVLRETTTETTWPTGIMPAGASVIIFAPFFHRDDERLEWADRFTPELWLDESKQQGWPLIPFSDGPAVCPARHLVQMVTSAMLAELLAGGQVRLKPRDRLRSDRPLPGTLNNYSLRFKMTG